MFRRVPFFPINPAVLLELARAMVTPAEEPNDKPIGTGDEDENTALLPSGELRLPAGYTYFGQFVDHDITFDPVSSLQRQNDPDALHDFRTPAFDLDSIYGRGPSDQPYLYEANGLHIVLGNDVNPGDPSTNGPDLVRVRCPRRDGNNTLTGEVDLRAVIGDPRNDENLIVSQLQVAVISFHNRVVDDLIAEHSDWSSDDLFKEAQRLVRWHYQWVVIHDFLVRLVGEEVVRDLLPLEPWRAPAAGGASEPVGVTRRRGRFYRWNDKPYMPVEFSVAAYRFGHSMIRPSYLLNDIIPVPVADGFARIPVFSDDPNPLTNLNGFRELPGLWGVQWKYFLPGILEPTGPNDASLPQPSYKIDTQLARPLLSLPASTAHPEVLSPGDDPGFAQILAYRNLVRGLRLGVPSGQSVARAMGMTPLTDDVLLDGLALSPAARLELSDNVPLWFYVLKEAEIVTSGAHLGPVGGRIVAEVLVGLLDGDPMSFLSVDPTWRPNLPAAAPGHFTLTDLINHARPNLGTASPVEPPSEQWGH